MEIAVEHDLRRCRLPRRQLLDRIERGEIAVKPADDIKRLGGKIRRAREHRRRIGVIARAIAAGLLPPALELGQGAREHVHSAASFSAPPQLEPWPAVQP